jgi:hypothetical protein
MISLVENENLCIRRLRADDHFPVDRYSASKLVPGGSVYGLNEERLGEQGLGNCQRYRETCR